MRYIRITEQEAKELKEVYTSSRYIIERKRSHCVLLSHQGKSINELAGIFGVSRLSITNWLDKWENGGFGYRVAGAANRSCAVLSKSN